MAENLKPKNKLYRKVFTVLFALLLTGTLCFAEYEQDFQDIEKSIVEIENNNDVKPDIPDNLSEPSNISPEASDNTVKNHYPGKSDNARSYNSESTQPKATSDYNQTNKKKVKSDAFPWRTEKTYNTVPQNTVRRQNNNFSSTPPAKSTFTQEDALNDIPNIQSEYIPDEQQETSDTNQWQQTPDTVNEELQESFNLKSDSDDEKSTSSVNQPEDTILTKIISAVTVILALSVSVFVAFVIYVYCKFVLRLENPYMPVINIRKHNKKKRKRSGKNKNRKKKKITNPVLPEEIDYGMQPSEYNEEIPDTIQQSTVYEVDLNLKLKNQVINLESPADIKSAVMLFTKITS